MPQKTTLNDHLFISKLGDLYEHFPTFIVKKNIVRMILSGTIKAAAKPKVKEVAGASSVILCGH